MQAPTGHDRPIADNRNPLVALLAKYFFYRVHNPSLYSLYYDLLMYPHTSAVVLNFIVLPTAGSDNR